MKPQVVPERIHDEILLHRGAEGACRFADELVAVFTSVKHERFPLAKKERELVLTHTATANKSKPSSFRCARVGSCVPEVALP